MASSGFSSGALDSLLSTGLNGLLLSNLLLGMYTVIYFGALYIYSRKSSKNWIVIGCISLSYLVYTVQSSIQWYLTKVAFINDGASQEATFKELYRAQWAFVADICVFLISALADGLLIWRCFNVWNRSFRVISLSSFLLVCEIALDLPVIVINAAADFNPSLKQGNMLDRLIGTSLFVTFATTLITTILIAYRIHSASKEDVLQLSKTRFDHIVEILIQSAAIYSMIAFANAIVQVIPVTANNTILLAAVDQYLSSFYFFIAGVAPVIMVARVAVVADTSQDTSAVSRVSGLQFRSIPPNTMQSVRGNIRSDDLRSMHEPKDFETKQSETLHIV